jgi:hypothetical protein
MDKIQGATATPDRKFTLGVPEIGTHGTIVSAEWLNHVQDEICNVILSENMSLDESSSNQLSAAIKQKIAALKANCDLDIEGFKTEVEQWKKQIQSTILTLAKDSELKRLQAIADTDKHNLLHCFEILNNFNNEFVEKVLKILKNLDQNYFIQESRFTEVFNAYGIYVLNQQQVNKQEIEKIQKNVTAQLKEFSSHYALVGHNHDESYAVKEHNHNSLYAALNHNHNGQYADKSHDHNSLYAALSHNHNGQYADKSHDHNSLYAALNHQHNALYALIGHSHSEYASKYHDHDGRYADRGHSHSEYASTYHNHDGRYATKDSGWF